MTSTPHARRRRALASALAASLAAGGVVAGATSASAAPLPSATATAAARPTTITPNPAYAGEPFQGWGNSLVWFANATGDYPDELREQLFDLVFGADGLNMNVARYNIGGGRASDVGDYFRQGAAVDGYWAEDLSDDPASLYGPVTTSFADRAALAAAWDPDDEASYDWTKDATQRWWLERLAQEREDLVLEGFANSPPFFMTNSGYTSGGASSTTEQVLTSDGVPAKFAGYLTRVVEHLEDTYDVDFQTVTPFNEPCTGYWSTPSGRLADGITPFTNAVKKPQEGAQICAGPGAGQQQALVKLLADELQASTSDAVVSANDETHPQNFNNAWKQYDAATRADVGQINVHTYWSGGRMQARDNALASEKPLWMSETGGDFVGGGFDPVAISGGLGLAQKITEDLRELQPNAYVLWQEVEDFYNMEKGENLNWGSVFIDFDCEWTGTDGSVVAEADAIGFKSQRRVADAIAAGGTAADVPDCSIVTNSKFDTMRNFMRFITPGDRFVAVDDATSTAAVGADGTSLSVVHTNATTSDRTVVLDLSRFGDVAQGATVTPYVTTQAADVDDTSTALVAGTPVTVDRDARTATLTVPARSVTTFEVSGVSGVAPAAEPLRDGDTVQVVGVQSGKALTLSTASTTTITSPATTSAALPRQLWVAHETSDATAVAGRRTFALESVHDGRFLGATSAGTDLRTMPLDEASTTPGTRWHLTTLDGVTWSLVNAVTASSLEVGGQSTSENARVGVYESNGGANQRWTVRSVSEAPVVAPLTARTQVGVPATLPATVVPTYSWGSGVATPITWNVPADAWQTAGTVTITGTGTDVYGNPVTDARVVVEVGQVAAADPVSVTVVAGSSPALLAAWAPSTVPTQVGLGDSRFDLPVTWALDDVDAAALAGPGRLTVRGTVSASATGAADVPATLHVIVVPAGGEENVALTSTPSAADFTESGYPVSRTINGNTTDKGWSNWKDTKETRATLTYALARPEVVESVRVYFYKDGSSYTWPTTMRVQHRDPRTGTWVDSGDLVSLPEQATAPVVDLPVGAATDAVRVVLDARAATHIIVSEVEVYAQVGAASSVTDLARLTVGGVDVDGLDPAVHAYEVKARGSQPVVRAVPVDSAATVDVACTRDVVTVTVTAPSGATSLTTVTLDKEVGLDAVRIAGSPVAGGTLTAQATADPADARLSYRWTVGGVTIPGATGSTWTPGLTHVGASVAAEITAVADGFRTSSVVTAPVVVLDGRAASAVRLTPSATSVVEGASVTLAATVTSAQQSAVAGGTVAFYDGSAQLGSVKVGADGRAELVVKRPAVGTRTYTATFAPAASAETVVAPATSGAAVVTVTKAPVEPPVVSSRTTVSVSPRSLTTQVKPVVTVGVTAAGKAASGTVTVTVRRGAKVVATRTGTLSRGTVKVTFPRLTTHGAYQVTARYAGAAGVGASEGKATVTVLRATTTKASLAKKKVRASARAQVAVKVGATPRATVTGKVKVAVYRGSKVVSTKTVSLKKSGATVRLDRLKQGKYTVRVTYLGSSSASSSKARSLKLTVTR